MPERVHRQQRRHAHRVAEVVAVHAAGEGRAGGRLRGHEPGLLPVAQVRPHERGDDAGEVGPAADAPHDHVGVLAGLLHLRDRLLADHGLVQQHVVQHRSERVVGALVAGRHLDRLGDRDAERARRVRGLRAPGLGPVGGAAVHRRAPHLHHRAAVGLLVVARADHEDLALHAHQPAGEGKRGAPLPGTGLGREPAHALLAVVVGLRHGRVGLVRARRRGALVLVVDVRRGIELALEAPRPVQRRRAPQLVDLAHLVGDLDLRLGRDLLRDQAHREDRREVVGARRALRRGAAAARARRAGPASGSPSGWGSPPR